MQPSSFLYALKNLLVSVHGRRLHVRAALWAPGFTVVFLLVCSWVIVPIEGSAPRATITTFPRALWWSIETATTVGYGDFYPVTAWGRVVATLVMLVGIAAFSIVTAAIATWFVGGAARGVRRLVGDTARLEQRGKTDATDEIRALHDRFDRLEQLIKDPRT